MASTEAKVVWECPWWRVEERAGPGDGADRRWYSVHRKPTRETVTAIGVTADGRCPLLRQWREPVQEYVWEFPAGLPNAGESLEAAAAREFEEETGWRPARMLHLFSGTTSPGLTDERFNGYLALDLQQVADGGGLDGERIECHLVALAELSAFLLDRSAAGELVDVKCLAHLVLAQRKLDELGLRAQDA